MLTAIIILAISYFVSGFISGLKGEPVSEGCLDVVADDSEGIASLYAGSLNTTCSVFSH